MSFLHFVPLSIILSSFVVPSFWRPSLLLDGSSICHHAVSFLVSISRHFLHSKPTFLIHHPLFSSLLSPLIVPDTQSLHGYIPHPLFHGFPLFNLPSSCSFPLFIPFTSSLSSSPPTSFLSSSPLFSFTYLPSPSHPLTFLVSVCFSPSLQRSPSLIPLESAIFDCSCHPLLFSFLSTAVIPSVCPETPLPHSAPPPDGDDRCHGRLERCAG